MYGKMLSPIVNFILTVPIFVHPHATVYCNYTTGVSYMYRIDSNVRDIQ